MRLSERIYRLLLKTYPKTYWNRYEQPMAQLFADQLREARTGPELMRLWLRTLADLLRTLPARYSESARSFLGLEKPQPLASVPWNASVRQSVFHARREASSFGKRWITPEHLLLGILREDLDIPELAAARSAIENAIEAAENAPRRPPPSEDLPIDAAARLILLEAKEEAARSGASACTPRHLLAAMLRQEQTLAARLLRRHGFEAARLRPES